MLCRLAADHPPNTHTHRPIALAIALRGPMGDTGNRRASWSSESGSEPFGIRVLVRPVPTSLVRRSRWGWHSRDPWPVVGLPAQASSTAVGLASV